MTNKLPPNFCVAPFLQMTTHPTGSSSPCPYLGGTTWSNKQYPIKKLWTRPELENLRQQFLQGERPDICHRCWHEEKNNKHSLRLRLFDPESGNSDFQSLLDHDLVSRICDGSYQTGPAILTLKNGNVCNAKCRVCHPNDSSRWIADARKLAEQTNKSYYAINVDEQNWSDQQLLDIYSMCESVVRLELFGGEPMYNRQVRDLLEKLVNNRQSQHIDLYINTNGSVDIAKHLPFITQFRQVEVGVSIDDIGARFDYIRHGLDYSEVVANLRSLQQYLTQSGIVYSIDSITTVQIQNVFYLPEIRDAVCDLLPLPPFWNILIKPDWLFIKNLPDSVKQVITERLVDDEFREIINIIQQPREDTAWQQFLDVTHRLDTIRDEDFAKVFPEFAELIKYNHA